MKNLKKLMSVVLTSAVVLLLSAGTLAAQKSSEQLFEKALYAEEMKGDLAEAVRIYKQVLTEDPVTRQVSARALLHIGMCYEKLGSEMAGQTYKEIISKYSDQEKEVSAAKERISRLEAYTAGLNREAEKHMKNGNDLFKTWEYDSAIKEYENAIKLRPGSSLALNAQYCIGQSLFRAGKYEGALATFTKLIEENPKSSIAHVTELMVAQLMQTIQDDKSKVKQVSTPDENTVIDPETGIKYAKLKSFVGKNDQITWTWSGFNISPDGRFLVEENKVVPVDGSDAFDLVGMDASRTVYAPGMKRAAFYADSAIWVVPVSPETGKSAGKPVKLVSGHYKYQFPVSWSPDGERLLFGRVDNKVAGDIWIANVRDSKQLPVTNSPDIENQPVWSPDGKLIVYRIDRNLWMTGINGSEKRMIIQNGAYPHWSHDSKWIFNYSQRNNYLYSLDSNKNFKFITPQQVGDLASFSSDGKKVLFYKSSRDMKWPLKIVSSAGGPPFSPFLNTDVYDSYWLPDYKKMIALTENGQEYKIFSLTGGPSEEIKIEANVNGKPTLIMFSDDMTKVAFYVRRADGLSDIYIASFSVTDARVTGPVKLVFQGWSAGAFNVYMDWSHDGKKMAFVHDGDIWIVRLDDGKQLRITNTPEKEMWISFSPDGNMVSYFIPAVQSGTLHIIPSLGGNPKVLNGNCKGAKWLNDSKSIALLTNNDLQVISLDGQRTRQIFNIKDIGLSNDGISLELSPDGKSLAFVGYVGDNDHSLIIIYSMETGKTTRLADENLEDGKYLLKWSNDGKWLSYLTYENVKVRPEGTLWEADFDQIKEKLTGK